MTYIQPTLAVLLLVVWIASFRYWRSGKPGKPRLLFLAAGALFLLSWPPIAQLTMRMLETPWPPRMFAADGGQAIVVLSSAVYAEEVPMPEAVLGSDTAERCQYAAWLHRHWRPLPILAAGGTGDGDVPPYSAVMRTALERGGVPPQAIWLEERSHSTHENAVYAATLLRQKGIHTIVLVTDAYHMLRAAACFRKEGLTVIPAACGYRSYHGFHALDLLPGWEAIAWNEDAAHEAIGLVWYRMRGWI